MLAMATSATRTGNLWAAADMLTWVSAAVACSLPWLHRFDAVVQLLPAARRCFQCAAVRQG
jgi:hypothetical protein